MWAMNTDLDFLTNKDEMSNDERQQQQRYRGRKQKQLT